MNSEQQHAPRSLFSLPFFISFALSFSLCTANPWCVCRQFPHYSNGTLLCKGLPPTSSSWREKERKQAPSSRCCCSKAAVPLGSGQCECSLPGMTTRVDHNGEESGRLRDVENEKKTMMMMMMTKTNCKRHWRPLLCPEMLHFTANWRCLLADQKSIIDTGRPCQANNVFLFGQI